MRLQLLLVLTIVSQVGVARGATTFYGVGNSLTWDHQPRGMAAMAESAGEDLDVGYHILCNAPLDRISKNPDSTCVSPTGFGRYEEALSNHSWDHVSFQPYPRAEATLGNDLAAIERFVELTRMNPENADTRFYLLQSWPQTTEWNRWHTKVEVSSLDQPAVPWRGYYDILLNESRSRLPSAELLMIPSADVVFRVMQEMEAGNIPEEELYRDNVHMSYSVGRFLASTTALATILGQDPTGLPKPTGFFGGAVHDEQFRTAVQEIVWDVVNGHPSTGVGQPDGDLNFDGRTDGDDFLLFQAGFGQLDHASAQDGDVNGDGRVDGNDFLIWQANFTSAGAAAAATGVPEPHSLWIAAVLSLLSLRRVRVASSWTG